MLDLPGAYNLNALSNDQAVTRCDRRPSRRSPSELLVCVADATNLRLHLRMVLEARSLGIPMVVALNKMDRAEKLGISIDVKTLAQHIGVPVVPTVGINNRGARALEDQLDGVPASKRSTWSSRHRGCAADATGSAADLPGYSEGARR